MSAAASDASISDISRSDSPYQDSDSSSDDEGVDVRCLRLVSQYHKTVIPMILRCINATKHGARFFANNGEDLPSIVETTTPGSAEELNAAIRLELQKINYFLSGESPASVYDASLIEKLLRTKVGHSTEPVSSDTVLQVLHSLTGKQNILASVPQPGSEVCMLEVSSLGMPSIGGIQDELDHMFWFEATRGGEASVMESFSPVVTVENTVFGRPLDLRLDLGRYTREKYPQVMESLNRWRMARERLATLKGALKSTATFEGHELPSTLETAANALRASGNVTAANEIDAEVERLSKVSALVDAEIANVSEIYKTPLATAEPLYVARSIAVLSGNDWPVSLLPQDSENWVYTSDDHNSSRSIPQQKMLRTFHNSFTALVFYERDEPDGPPFGFAPYVREHALREHALREHAQANGQQDE